jgi:hypothetical protein
MTLANACLRDHSIGTAVIQNLDSQPCDRRNTSMAHLLRGKQAGIHNDLSAGLNADIFVLDHVGQRPLLPAREADSGRSATMA